jgi:hypothetical protein
MRSERGAARGLSAAAAGQSSAAQSIATGAVKCRVSRRRFPAARSHALFGIGATRANRLRRVVLPFFIARNIAERPV